MERKDLINFNDYVLHDEVGNFHLKVDIQNVDADFIKKLFLFVNNPDNKISGLDFSASQDNEEILGISVLNAIAEGLNDQSNYITSLDFSYNNFAENDFSIIANALVNHQALQILNLDTTSLEDGVSALAEIIAHNQLIHTLNLGGAEIGDLGIDALELALQNNKTLKKLDLSNNEITNKGVVKLAFALQTNPNISWLNLMGNRFGDKGAEALATLFQLKNLNVEYNLIKTPNILNVLVEKNPIKRFGTEVKAIGFANVPSLVDLSIFKLKPEDESKLSEDLKDLKENREHTVFQDYQNSYINEEEEEEAEEKDEEEEILLEEEEEIAEKENVLEENEKKKEEENLEPDHPVQKRKKRKRGEDREEIENPNPLKKNFRN